MFVGSLRDPDLRFSWDVVLVTPQSAPIRKVDLQNVDHIGPLRAPDHVLRRGRPGQYLGFIGEGLHGGRYRSSWKPGSMAGRSLAFPTNQPVRYIHWVMRVSFAKSMRSGLSMGV